MKDQKNEKKLQERQIRKQESILQAAVQVFEEEGYERASMDQIAERAKASKRTVYNYFSSKENLLHAVIQDLVAQQNELKQVPYSSDEELAPQLARFVDAELYMVNDPSRLSLVRILSSILVRNPELSEEASQGSLSQTTNLASWVEAARAEGRLTVADPQLAGQIFYGLVQGTFNFPALFFSLPPEEEVRRLKAEVIAVFLSRYQS